MSWAPNAKYCATVIYPDDNAMPVELTEFKSFEEFMIYANLNKCIFPLIENWYVEDDMFNTYHVKTIDLKTNEVLFDDIKRVLKQLSEQYN